MHLVTSLLKKNKQTKTLNAALKLRKPAPNENKMKLENRRALVSNEQKKGNNNRLSKI